MGRLNNKSIRRAAHPIYPARNDVYTQKRELLLKGTHQPQTIQEHGAAALQQSKLMRKRSRKEKRKEEKEEEKLYKTMADERCAFLGFMSLQRQNNPPPVGWRLNRREISVRGRDKKKRRPFLERKEKRRKR